MLAGRAYDRMSTTEVREAIFLEALDCFCGVIADRSQREAFAALVASHWSLPQERAEHFIKFYRPSVQSTTASFSVGRVTLHIPTNELKVQFCL